MKLNKMKKEDLELMSYTKIAELYLKENKTTKNTAELFKEVCSLLNKSESEYQSEIADFFQSLTTSKDFILLEDGNWDLKVNHTIKLDIDEIYEDKEEDEEIIEEVEDEMEEEEIDDFDSVEDDEVFEDDDDDLSELTILNEEEMEE